MTYPSLFDELGDRQCCRCGEVKPVVHGPPREGSGGRRRSAPRAPRPLREAIGFRTFVHSDGMERVQVKTTTMKQGASYFVHLTPIGGNKTQVKARKFDPADHEWLFVVCGDATAYMIPTASIDARTGLVLGRKYEHYRLED